MIDDDTVRHWSRMAACEAGFPRLRYLFLRFQPCVTARGLGYLDAFPALEACVTSRCGVIVREAKKVVKGVGWKMTRYV